MFKSNYPLLGILGGMGPYAGLDFLKKVFQNTNAGRDQEHLPVLLASLPHEIPGRPEYLLKMQPVNPGKSMADLAMWLESAGVTHACVPCNTAHAAPIWNLMQEEMQKAGAKIQFIHILEELKKELQTYLGDKENLRVGILATSGSIQTKLYDNFMEGQPYTCVYPTEKAQELFMDSIFNKEYGIKACSDPVQQIVLDQLEQVMKDLEAQDVDVFVLGCSELSFALTEAKYFGKPCLDPIILQARALIRATYPEKLTNI